LRKLLLIFGILLSTISTVWAAKLPDEVQEYIIKTVPNTDIRFDGVVILPDNTIYLPLFPSLFSDINKLKVKESFPANKELNQKPDIIIFNNDFVLMKVLTDGEGHKTVLHQTIPPLQVRTGLLPQDMLVPSGLVLPENLKGIIGNLKVDVKSEDVIKLNTKESFEEFLAETEPVTNQAIIPQLKNKILFITTNYSKNIQVLDPAQNTTKYSLAQKSIPIDAKAVSNGKFLLVTSFERPFLDIVSVADSRFIKQINLSSFPEEILIDSTSNKAYVSSPTASTIFVIDLKSMSLIQKIKVNGYCEKLLLSEDKLFYVDKFKNEIWAIEMKNNYELKDIGKFPNVSALAFINNNLYIASRTKSRIAVIDYSTLGLISEFTTVSKPVAFQAYGDSLYVLGAQDNKIQRINTSAGKVVDTISLNTEGFSTGFNRIDNSEYAVVTDIKKNQYTIIDLSKGKILKTYSVNIPINEVIITNKVKLFD
jgi:DNA-binding beta-propeller fold protein YncE